MEEKKKKEEEKKRMMEGLAGKLGLMVQAQKEGTEESVKSEEVSQKTDSDEEDVILGRFTNIREIKKFKMALEIAKHK